MLQQWHFNVLFFVGVGGALLLLFGPELGLDVGRNPTAATGVGAILTYVLTQRALSARDDKKKAETKKEEDDELGSK